MIQRIIVAALIVWCMACAAREPSPAELARNSERARVSAMVNARYSGYPPGTAVEAAAIASLIVRYWGETTAAPFVHYADCLAQGAVEPGTERVTWLRGPMPPTGGFKAVLFTANQIVTMGSSAADPFFRLYARQCWRRISN